jgi:hypothetical protein
MTSPSSGWCREDGLFIGLSLACFAIFARGIPYIVGSIANG